MWKQGNCYFQDRAKSKIVATAIETSHFAVAINKYSSSFCNLADEMQHNFEKAIKDAEVHLNN